jgi:hypothetical protein
VVLVHSFLSRNANPLQAFLVKRFLDRNLYQAQKEAPDKRGSRPLFTQSWYWTLVQAI